MKTVKNNHSPIFTFLVTLALSFLTGMANAQTISGPTSVNQGDINNYTLSGVTVTSWNVSGASYTSISNGVRVTAGSGNYTVSANFTQSPNYTAKFVTVTPTGPTPPSTPPVPSVNKFCNYTTLTRANPPSGVTYYWQSSSSGTSTSNSASSINRSSGTVYYLRARGNSSGLWSPIRSVNYTIDYAPSAPLTPTIDAQNCGSTVLRRANPNPTANVTWYWQSTSSGTSTGNSQPTISLNSGTVYYLRAKTNGINCWGPARSVSYTVDNGPATPAAPTVQSSSCGTVVLARANPPSGVTYYWQTSASGTSTSNSSSTISLTSGSIRYLRGRNNNGCWSSASSRTYSISSPPATPATPTVSANNCDNTVIARSNPPSGVTWYWQTSSSGTSTANSASTITKTNGTTQYLRARNSAGCWSSSSSSVGYSITYSPSAPLTPTIDAQNCGSTVLRRDDPNPTANVTWYWQSSSSGTSTANSQPTISLNSGTVYYLRAKTNGANCWGPARPVNYTIDNGPATPAAPTIQSSNCGSVVLARSNPPSGVTFYWQSSASGTSTANSSSTFTVSSGSTYYLKARNSNGCWSSASSVNYSISTAPATPSVPTVSANNCDNTVLARANPPSGVTWYWQNSATGTDTSNSNATITKTNGTVQYLRARNSAGCWSTSSASRTYTINYSPSAPLTPTIDAQNCGSTILRRDDPNPTANVTWYWQSTSGGTSTANSQPTISLNSGTVYYLRAKANGANCWGPARSINYTVNIGPAAPATPTITSNECGSTVLSRSNPPSGVTFYWQTSAAGTNTSESGTTITLTSGTTHYLRARNNSSQCWSTASSVSYSIDTPPATPATPTISQTNCGDTVLARSNPPSGVTWYWQDSAAGTSTANSGATITKFNGTVQFLRAKSNSSNCWSPTSASVTYTVTTGPSAPLSPAIDNFCGSTVLTRDNPNPTAPVTWYWQTTADGTSTANDDLTVTLTSGTVYYLRAKTNGAACWGEPRVINYTVNQIPDAPTGTGVSQCGEGTFELVASLGPNADTLRWYDVASGGTSLGSGETFTTPVISETTSFYVESFNSVTSCVSPTRHEIQAVVTSAITWYFDADGDNHASDSQISCGSPGTGWTDQFMYVDDCDDSSYSLENDCGPTNPNECTPVSSTTYDPAEKNYVYTRSYQEAWPGQAPNSKFDNDDNYLQDITYFDGLGREIQQIAIRQSPDKKDIVSHMGYDDYGRQGKNWLPIHDPTENLGTYRTNDLELATKQYYKANYAEDFLSINAANINPYSEQGFEKSPLNRLEKQAAPGEDWKLGNGHEVELNYSANSANEVRKFKVILNFANNTYTPTLTETGNYLAGELAKTVSKDENHTGSTKNHTTEEFKDKQGRILLKRTYADMTGQAQVAHDTYYIYDDYGNLTYVLPPLMDGSSATLAQLNTNMKSLGYEYRYDHRNRLVEKRVPGKEWEYMVYNKLDQPLMTQDWNQRENGEWLFTKYDAFGRVAYTGKSLELNGSTAKSRSEVQNSVNSITTDLWVNQGESYTLENTQVNYNNGAYPTTTISEILTISYYDNYDEFDLPVGAPTGVTLLGKTETNEMAVHGLATGSKVKVLDPNNSNVWISAVTYYDDRARPIYSFSKNDYLQAVDIAETEFDFAGRPVKTKTSHTKNGRTVVTIDNFTYDHVGRLLAQTQCIGDATMGDSCNGTSGGNTSSDLILNGSISGDQIASNRIRITPDATILPTTILNIDPNAVGGNSKEELIVLNQYDPLGILINKKVGGKVAPNVLQSIGLQDVDYDYNVLGWLKQMNDPNNLGNSLFGFAIKHNDIADASKRLYNGNISQTLWDTQSPVTSSNPISKQYTYTYDALNRITKAVDNTGNYDLTSVAYDKHGNITDLLRSGHTDANATAFGVMDNLDYVYQGNQLLRVSDSATNTGFIDGNTGSEPDYTYDDNGNMISDANKGISTIEYNYLNLPIKVTINGNGNNGTIDFIYDATGARLKKIATNTTESAVTMTEYCSGYIYEGDGATTSLRFFGQGEGYVKVDGNNFAYVYQYADHLGNIRLSYTDVNQNNSNAVNLEIVEENNYYPFGLKHKGYNGFVSSEGNDAAQRWKFGGKEYQQDINLNWYDVTARNYDPALGRWMNIDPLADQMRRHSPYNYAFDNPIYFIDADGMAPQGNSDGYGTISETSSSYRETKYEVEYEDGTKVIMNSKKFASMLLGDTGGPLIIGPGSCQCSYVNEKGFRTTEVEGGAGELSSAFGRDFTFGHLFPDSDNLIAEYSEDFQFAIVIPDPAFEANNLELIELIKVSILALDIAGMGSMMAATSISLPKNKVFTYNPRISGNINVYLSVEKGIVQYAGITNNLARRAAEHLRSKGINIEPLMKNLSHADAKAVEQALIKIHGLNKDGGTLINKINSISPKNPIYAQQLERGLKLLKSIGY